MELYDLAAAPPFELNTLRNSLVPLHSLDDGSPSTRPDWARWRRSPSGTIGPVSASSWRHDSRAGGTRRPAVWKPAPRCWGTPPACSSDQGPRA